MMVFIDGDNLVARIQTGRVLTVGQLQADVTIGKVTPGVRIAAE
jgi:hypothetical protein